MWIRLCKLVKRRLSVKLIFDINLASQAVGVANNVVVVNSINFCQIASDRGGTSPSRHVWQANDNGRTLRLNCCGFFAVST